MSLSPPVRLAFVLHLMQVAGAEVLVAETIRRLGSEIDPVVLCLDGVGKLGEKMRDEGVPVVSLDRRPGFDYSVVARLAKEVEKRRIEVVHAHQYTPFFYSALAKLRTPDKIHLIFTEHGRHYPDLVSLKRRVINRLFLARLADEITGVCRFSMRALGENDGFAGRRIDIIENGVDADRYGPVEDRSAVCDRIGIKPTRRYISCIARFHKVKDHKTLIRAFEVIARERNDVDLLLAGDGPLRGALEQQVEKCNLRQRVVFLGSREDVPDILRVSDILVLMSVSEAASLTLLEAMASALPVVATNVGGNPEIVRNEIDGILIKAGDAESAARAINRILSDSELARRLGRSGRKRVLASFSLERTVTRYYRRYIAAAKRIRAESPC
jgi:glycosyltransferase involved in cell wall biosynthesis